MAKRKTGEYQESLRVKKALINKEKTYEVLAGGFFLLLFGFVALFQTNGYINITVTKAMTMWIICGLAVAVFLGAWLVYKLGKNKTPFDFKKSVLNLGVPEWGAIAYLLICIISSLLSPYKPIVLFGDQGRFDGLITQISYVLIYFIISRYYRYKDWHGSFLSAVMLAVAFVGISQFYGHDFLGLYPEGYTLFNSSFMTFIGNINIVSTVASLMCVFFGLMFIKSPKNDRFLFLGTSLVMFYLQACAASDSGWVGIGFGLLLIIPFVFTNQKNSINYGALLGGLGCAGFFHYLTLGEALQHYSVLKSYWLIFAVFGGMISLGSYFYGKKMQLKRSVAMMVSSGVVILVLLSGIAGIEIFGKEKTSGNLYESYEMLHGNLEDRFMSARGYIWKSSLDLIQYHPVFGSGPDTLGILHLDKKGDEAVQVMGVRADKAHNEYLQYVVCIGIVGLLAYLLLLVGAIARWSKRHYDNEAKDEQTVINFAAGGAVVSYALQAVFNLSVTISAAFFWMLLGVAAGKKEQGGE